MYVPELKEGGMSGPRTIQILSRVVCLNFGHPTIRHSRFTYFVNAVGMLYK